MKLLKRLYRWVVGWADHPAGPIALFCIAFAESSFFPIAPDVLLIALALGKPKRSFYFAFICLVGSVLGGALGYLIGWGAWSATQDFFFRFIVDPDVFAKVGTYYNDYSFWAVFLAGLTPIPYKVFTIAAGVFQIDFLGFMFASLLGRGARFFLVATMIYFFGERVRKIVEKHFEWAAIAFALLLVAGFLVLRWLPR